MARRRKGRDVHGWLVVDKPAGPSSSAVVGRVRRALDARKAGHAGTLDPDATGLLAIALGEATKTVPFVADAPKGYRFRVAWGAETATDDAAGAVIETAEARPDRAAVERALVGFRGDILQVPPQVSAVKVAGERAYARARAGERSALTARPLRVERLDLVAADHDGVELEMVCGKGGYVRAVARDLGRALGCLGHALWLRRLFAGPFRVEDAVPWDAVERAAAGGISLDDRVLPLETALRSVPERPCSFEATALLRHGNPAGVANAGDADPAWASFGGQAVALGRACGGTFHPTRVLVR